VEIKKGEQSAMWRKHQSEEEQELEEHGST